MTREAIGGHEGMTVYRTPDGILKEATTDDAWGHLNNEAYRLGQMAGSHAPHLLDGNADERWTLQEDLGHALSLDATRVVALGAPKFFDNCIDLLAALRFRGIYHGDLTPPNLAWPDEQRGLCALDWQESSRIGSDAHHKRATSDAWELLDTFVGFFGGWPPPLAEWSTK